VYTQRFILFSLLLFSLLIKTAHADEQGFLPEQGKTVVSKQGPDINGAVYMVPAVKDDELALVNGRALGIEIPDIRNTKLAAIILWDEVKIKRNVAVDQGTGQVFSKITVQGR
jgi:hypothetical protein